MFALPNTCEVTGPHRTFTIGVSRINNKKRMSRKTSSFYRNLVFCQIILVVCFVDKQLAFGGVEEEKRVFVAFLHYPASAIFWINLHLAVFAAHLLFGQ